MHQCSKLFSVLASVFLFIFLATAISIAAPVGINPKDAKFIDKAAQYSAAEVQITNLAQQRAQSPEVKQLAAKLHEDHMAADESLHDIAHDANVKMSKQPMKEQNAAFKRLSSLTGSAFDDAFLDQVIEQHEKNVTFYENQAKDGKSEVVSKYASKTLPTLKKHLEEAKSLRQQLKDKG